MNIVWIRRMRHHTLIFSRTRNAYQPPTSHPFKVSVAIQPAARFAIYAMCVCVCVCTGWCFVLQCNPPQTHRSIRILSAGKIVVRLNTEVKTENANFVWLNSTSALICWCTWRRHTTVRNWWCLCIGPEWTQVRSITHTHPHTNLTLSWNWPHAISAFTHHKHRCELFAPPRDENSVASWCGCWLCCVVRYGCVAM